MSTTPAKPFSLSVKAVVRDAQGRCLLLRRSAVNKHFVGCWEWPGGKVDAGEDFAHAVVREAWEESGLEVELTGVAGVTEFEIEKVHVVVLAMDVRVAGGELRLSEEHDAFDWVALADLAGRNLTPPNAAFMLEYARRKGNQS